MALELGFTKELTNTHFAVLAVLLEHYQHHQVFEPLVDIHLKMREREFRVVDKLVQVLLSVLTGCVTLSEVNQRLQAEAGLARMLGWKRFADQSSLSRTLDALDATSLEELRASTSRIWGRFSRLEQHDWRKYLWLDYDLSGLPCGPLAQESQKGYFSGKKTAPDGSWHA